MNVKNSDKNENLELFDRKSDGSRTCAWARSGTDEENQHPVYKYEPGDYPGNNQSLSRDGIYS